MSHIMLVKILFCYDFRDFVQKFIRGILLEFCHSSRHMALQAYRSKRSSTFMLCSVFVIGKFRDHRYRLNTNFVEMRVDTFC